MTLWAFEFDSLVAQCPECEGPPVEQRPGSTRLCTACTAKMDDFDRQAAALLTDSGGRTWYRVQKDVAEALRKAAAR